MDLDVNAPSVFANGHRVARVFELCDPLSPSLRPMGEVRRQEGGGEEELEGTEEKESRGDAHPAASDLQVPQGHESNFKNKLEGVCDLGSRAATGISSNRLTVSGSL